MSWVMQYAVILKRWLLFRTTHLRSPGESLVLFDPSLPTWSWFSCFLFHICDLSVKYCCDWIYTGVSWKPSASHKDAKGCLWHQCHTQRGVTERWYVTAWGWEQTKLEMCLEFLMLHQPSVVHEHDKRACVLMFLVGGVLSLSVCN